MRAATHYTALASACALPIQSAIYSGARSYGHTLRPDILHENYALRGRPTSEIETTVWCRVAVSTVTVTVKYGTVVWSTNKSCSLMF